MVSVVGYLHVVGLGGARSNALMFSCEANSIAVAGKKRIQCMRVWQQAHLPVHATDADADRCDSQVPGNGSFQDFICL